MKKASLFSLLLLMSCYCMPALASEPAPDKVHLSKLELPEARGAESRDVLAPSGEDRQLQVQKAGFMEFAIGKVREMNENHLLSRERMQVKQGTDGLYSSMFHEIDGQSLSCQLSRVATGNIPYVAVLSYQELVYAKTCVTPEGCRQGPFEPVEVIPNRHIFVYSDGSWQ